MEDCVSGMALIIAAAFLFGLAGLAVLLWAIANGQYDDLEGAAARVLLDDPAKAEIHEKT